MKNILNFHFFDATFSKVAKNRKTEKKSSTITKKTEKKQKKTEKQKNIIFLQKNRKTEKKQKNSTFFSKKTEKLVKLTFFVVLIEVEINIKIRK